MLTILMGTDWVACRDAMMQRIAQDVSLGKKGRILIVPEFISHDMERRLCSVAGNTVSRYAEVLSFTRLAKRVSEAVGHAAIECLDNGGRIVAMASAARQLHSRLKVYAPVETRPEFLTDIIDAVDEMKRCCITPEDLMCASKQAEGSLAQKLEELSLLLSCYDALCNQGKRDPRDQMTWLLEELESGTFASEHVFYIDGFPDFTRQHAAIIEHLICESEHVVICLNCDCVDSAQLAFEKTGRTAAEIINAAKKHGIETHIEQIVPPQHKLNVLREKLFQGKITQTLDDRLFVSRTDTIHQECLCAAERIMNLVRNGSRYRDIAVVCSDLTAYSNVLKMTMDRCHIPTYLSGTEPILSRSVISTVLAAIDTALGGFERQDVLRYLKSKLSPLDLEQCDRIENYAMLWGINGNRWLTDWEYHPLGLGMQWNDASQKMIRQLNYSRMVALEPLIALCDGFKNAENLGQQIKSLFDFFEEIELANRLDIMAKELDAAGNNREAQVLNQLWEILIGALEQLYDVLGHTVWDTESFSKLFKLLLSQYDVGTIPPVLDAVTIGPANAMRNQQAKHLIVLGALEGSFPGYAGSTGVFTDQERTALRALGVPLTGGALEGLQAEFSDIYSVFCGAEETVYISCPSGQPSFVYRRLAELSGGEVDADASLATALADKMEAGAFLARMNAKHSAEEVGVIDAYQQIKASAEHTIGSVSTQNIKNLYGSKLNLSASQIDKLADCRFHYFLRYGLRAAEQKEVTVDPAEFGTYVHAVLENTAREICEKGGFHHVSEEETLEIARKYSEEYTKERFSQIEAERVNYLFQRNVQELELIVRELWDELHSVQFAPVGFEVSFGDDCQMPAINCSGTTLQAQLRGFVDRVDSWKNGENQYFRVVDYKTGRKDFDYCDVFNGLGLQMLLYLFALEREGKDLLGDNPVPAGVQYFPARVPLISVDGQMTEEEAAAARAKNWKRKGLLLWDEQVLSAMESENAPYRMPYIRKKDGSISGDIADKEKFDMLKTYIFDLLRKLVDGIATGCVEPNPYTRGSSHNACTFCPYGAVCHKFTVENRRNYKAMSAQKFWEDVGREVSADG